MVAYNLLLSVLPLALIALFIGGQVLQSSSVEQSVLEDLRRLFPNAAESSLTDLTHGLQDSSAQLGVAALVASVWIGLSFWGALDTAFCRIYHLPCRKWAEQKRFALAMLVVVLLFALATVAIPTLQSVLVSGAENLPFGLTSLHGLVFAVTIVAGLVLLFGCLCIIYWAVPKGSIPWRAVWPGAVAATLAITIVDYAFPLYLSNVSSAAKIGTTLVFIAIVLLWFYVLAIIVLSGAVINAIRLNPAIERDP
jgi:membrane protein